MSQKYEKLKRLLKEMFQLDQPDLDFGLYRIMHAKADEVIQFLDRDLLPQVTQEFGQYRTADKAELERQLAKAIEQAESLGADPNSLPKVKELRSRLETEAVDITSLEGEVYDHLVNFSVAITPRAIFSPNVDTRVMAGTLSPTMGKRSNSTGRTTTNTTLKPVNIFVITPSD
jgi:hypothetical protein